MKQWSVNSELTFGPRFCAWAHWPSGCLWVTQMSAPPRLPERRLMKYRVLPSGVIRGSWSMESLFTVSGSRSGGVQSAPVPGHSPLWRTLCVTKMSVVVPRTRLSPLPAKRAK